MAQVFVDPKLFTVVLTSCGRFDLLEQTLVSFFKCFDSASVIVMEDSGKKNEALAFAARFPKVDMRVNEPKLGQMRSIDAAYRTVTTPYVIHLEDDWEFKDSLNLDAAVQLLTLRPQISGVVVGFVDYRKDMSAHTERLSVGGLDFDILHPKANRFWFSYTLNPSVVRVDLWREFGPFEKFITEKNISVFMKRRGKMVARLVPRIAFHIGDQRHVEDEFRPKRPRSIGGWIAYGWSKLKLRFMD